MADTVNTDIDNVIIFNRSALVTRTGKIPEFNDNRIDLSISPLPLILEDNTIRISLTGTSNWSMRNIRIKIDTLDRKTEERIEDRVEKLEKELRDTDGKLSSIVCKREKIEKWLSFPIPDIEKWIKLAIKKEIDLTPRIFPFKSWHAFVNTCEKMIEDLKTKERELDFKIYEISKEIEITRSTIKNEGPTTKEDPLTEYCKHLSITLCRINESHDYPRDIRISYIIPGPQWVPSYKLYIENNYRNTKFVMASQLAQRSGEDWQNAKLKFSSAHLQRVIQIPELPSKRIGRAQLPPPVSFRKKLPSSQELFSAFDEWEKKAREKIIIKTITSNIIIEEAEKLINSFNEIKTAEPVSTKSGKTGELCSSIGGKEFKPKPVIMKRMAVKDMSANGPGFAASYAPPAELCAPPPPQCVQPSTMTYKTMAEEECIDDEYYRSEPEPECKKAKSPVMDLLKRRRDESVQFQLASPAGRLMADKIDLPRDEGCVFGGEFDDGIMDNVSRLKIQDYSGFELESVENAYYRGQLRLAKKILLSERVIESEETIIQKISQSRARAYIDIFSNERIPSFQCLYETRGTSTIPWDGHPYRVDIMSEQAESKLEYRTIPMTDPQVFRRLVIKNPFSLPVPYGPVQVFVDNAYIFTTSINDVGKEGEAIFPLGVEQNIKISRNVSFHQHEEKGITGSTSIATHEIEIHIRSYLPEKISLEVIERIPVKDENEKKIDIKILHMEPKGEKMEFLDGQRIRGTYKWDVNIEPAGDAYINIKYQISLPGKMEVIGGNRRV